MKKTITAIFDTVDSADLALMRLRQNRIEFDEVRVRPLGFVDAPMQERDPVLLAFPGLSFQAPYGPPVMRGYNAGVETDGEDIRDAINEEAMLDVKINEPDVKRAVEIIISSHGRRIRQW